MNIELASDQERILQQGLPVQITDPGTQRASLADPQRANDRGSEPAASTPCDQGPIIPAGVRRSQEAFWRDLPELLKNPHNHGKWVCYHGYERVGIAAIAEPLIRECLRRGLRRDQYDLDIVQSRDIPPWEPEEVEDLGPWHFEDPSSDA